MSVLGVVLLASCRPDGFVAVCIGQCLPRDRQSLFAVLLDSVRLYLYWRLGRGSSLSLWAFLVSVIRFLCSAQRVMDLPWPCSVSAIGRVAFRLIFLPVRVLDGIAELLPRREISLGSNLLLMALISRLADRRCPCSAYRDSPHLYL